MCIYDVSEALSFENANGHTMLEYGSHCSRHLTLCVFVQKSVLYNNNNIYFNDRMNVLNYLILCCRDDLNILTKRDFDILARLTFIWRDLFRSSYYIP